MTDDSDLPILAWINAREDAQVQRAPNQEIINDSREPDQDKKEPNPAPDPCPKSDPNGVDYIDSDSSVDRVVDDVDDDEPDPPPPAAIADIPEVPAPDCDTRDSIATITLTAGPTGKIPTDGLADIPPECRPRNLREALDRVIAGNFLDPDAMRHVRSDNATIAKLTGRPLESLPCDPVQLRPILKKVLPARHRMSPKRWSTVKSSAARVLKLQGWHATDDVLRAMIGDPWRAAIARLPYGPQKATIGKLARYCERAGIPIEEMDEMTVEGLRAWLEACTLDCDIGHTISSIRRHWNWLVANHPGWPSRRLHAPRDPRCYAFAPDQLPASFIAAVDQLCEGMRKPRPLDPRFSRKYTSATIYNARSALYRAATTVVLRGHLTREQIVDLRAVVKPDSVRVVLEDHYERVGKPDEWAPSACTLMCTLRRAARQSGVVTAAELAELGEMGKLIQRPKVGISTRATRVVAQFDDERLLLRFWELSDELFRSAERMLAEGYTLKAATLYRRALGLALLKEKPLRRETLSSLDIERHLRRDGRGRIFGMLVPGTETKNGLPSEVLFSEGLVRHVERYLTAFRPLLDPGDSSALFPGRGRTTIHPQTMARDIKRLVESQVGAEFHVHAIRNLIATMLLDDNARNAPVAQRMLDHASVKTTTRHYGQQRTRGAQREYNAMLERRMQRLRRGKRIGPQGRGKGPRGGNK